MFWTRIRSLVRRLRNRSQVEHELDEEIRSYVEQAVHDKMVRGMSREDARREALVEFGGTEQVKELMRQSRVGAWLDTLLGDIQYALRVLRKNPSFTLLAVLTTALGIGAATATFSVVDMVLLRPLPYKESGRLIQIWPTVPAWRTEPALQVAWDRWGLDYYQYLEFRKRQTSFDDVVAYATGAATLVEPGGPRRIAIGKADAGFFDLIGLPAIRGRLIQKEDERADAPRVAVLSHDSWLRYFGADPNVLGKTAIVEQLSATTYTVIGVLPQNFQVSAQNDVGRKPAPDLWIPIGAAGLPADFSNDVETLGRLREEASLANAEKETARIFAELPPNPTVPLQISLSARLVPRLEQEAGSAKMPLVLVFAASGLLLLIACGNVANLLVDRAVARQHEMALRAALGASRIRIVRQLLTESLVLSVAGGFAGIILASWFIRGLVRLAPGELPRMNEIGLDSRVLLFMIGSSIASGILFGLTPALSFIRTDVHAGLKSGSQNRGSRRSRMQGVVTVGEISMSFLLLVGAGLVTQSLFRLSAVNTGLRPDRLLTVQVVLPRSRYADEKRIRSFYQDLLPRLRSLPGMQAITGISIAPFTNRHSVVLFVPEGVQLPPGKKLSSVENRMVFANYFEVAGTPIIEGRAFTEADINAAGQSGVVIVNRAMARRFWPGQSAINKPVPLDGGGTAPNVIGIAENAREFNLGEDIKPMIYFPGWAWADLNDLTLLIRTAGDPAQLAAAIRHEIQSVDKDLPIERMETMENLIAATYTNERYRTILINVFALAAIFLALSGLYGVISRSVAQRTRELGIRIAIGARPGAMVWLVLRHSLGLAITGILIGCAVALAVTRLISGFLFGITPTDVPTYAAIAGVLVAMSIAASYVPARRAARIDPAECLRSD